MSGSHDPDPCFTWLVITLGVRDSSVALSLSQGEPINIKTMFGVNIVRLTITVRSRTTELEEQGYLHI